MKFLKSHKKLIGVLLIIIVIGVAMPTHEASAFCTPFLPGSDCMESLLLGFAKICLTIVSLFISLAALLLEGAIKISQDPSFLAPDVIHQVWGIVRNIVNMFFILVLIIMAFGTIFDMPHYTFKDMFVKFLIAALLINFSFVIVEYILSIANGISLVFIKQLGTSIGSRFADSLVLGKITSQEYGQYPTGVGNVFPTLVTILMFLVFAIITMGALLSAFIFVLLRIIVMWILIILAPVAWFGYTLPALKGETWDKWWSYFISWAFFLPVYLFFVMIAAIIVGAKGKIGVDVDFNSVQNLEAGAIAGYLFGIIGLQDFLFFAVAIFFLIGGIKIAFTVGNFAANGAGAVMNFAQGRVKALPVFPSPRFLGGTGRMKSASDLQGGVMDNYETMLEEGLPPRFGKTLKAFYGGKEGEKTARSDAKNMFAQWAGYRHGNAPLIEDEKKAKDHHKAKRLEEIQSGSLTAKALGDELKKGNKKIVDILGNIDTHLLADYEIAAEKGLLSEEQFDDLMENLATKSPGMAKDMTSTYYKGNLKEMSEKEILKIVNPTDDGNPIYRRSNEKMTASRKEVAQLLISDDGKKKMKNMTIPVKMLEGIVEDFGGETSKESKRFLKEVAKVQPKAVMRYKISKDPKALEKEYPKKDWGTGITSHEQAFYSDHWTDSKEDISGLDVETWDDKEFRKEYARRLSGRSHEALKKYRIDMGNTLGEHGGKDFKAKQERFSALIDAAIAAAPKDEKPKS